MHCPMPKIGRALTAAVMLVLAASCIAQQARPVVALAGGNYKTGYVAVCESLGADAVQIPGVELESIDRLSGYDAVVAVSNGDMGHDGYGFTDAAQAALTEYVAGGGRLLCTYGCAPPAQILGGTYASFGRGSHWHLADTDHPITDGMQFGQVVVYGAYRAGVSGLDERARVLLRESSGAPAALVTDYGTGCVIYTCGDLAYAGAWDATAAEFRDRVMTYLIYGRAQERFGPQLTAPRAPVRQWPRVITPRALALPDATESAALIAPEFSRLPDGIIPSVGYSIESVDATWRISAPAGNESFSPWISIPIGSEAADAGKRYRLSARAQLTELPGGTYAPAHFCMRFYNIDGVEIPHSDIATGDISSDNAVGLRTEAVAPEGTALVTAELVAMLPAGAITVEQVRVEIAQTAEEQFAAETPLQLAPERPRALMSTGAAAEFPRKVTNDDTGPFGASPAGMFASILKRADAYLIEDAIRFGSDQSLPWPPARMPAEGGGLSWNPLANALAERLKSLSIAYIGTGDERYGNRAKELLLALCRWDQWSDPVNSYIALEIGNISIGVAFANDLCYALMNDQERSEAAEAIRRNALLPMYSELSSGMGNTNGYALWAAAMGLCAISVHGEVTGASECIRLSEDCMLDYFDRRATDHRTEGQGYDAWAYGLLIYLADALKRNCGADHLDHPFFPTLVDFGVSFMANDRAKQAWFADAGGAVSNVPWHFPYTLLGAWTANPNAGWYLKETQTLTLTGYDHMKLIACDMGMPVAEHAPAPPGAVFPRAGWASLRSGWERDGVFVALQCSSAAQGHSHEDQNNFHIYDGPRMMAMDCGYASGLAGAIREFARGTVGHNCILVDGRMQVAKRGSIPFYRSTDVIDYAMGDATQAYSSALVERAHRHLLLIKPRLLLVIDDLRAAGVEREFQWLLHPHSWEGDSGLAEVTRAGSHIAVGAPPQMGDVDLLKSGHAMKLRFLEPEGMVAEYVVYPGAEKYNPYIQATSPRAARTVMVTLIEIGELDVANPGSSVEDATVSFTATVDGKPIAVTLHLAGNDGSSPRLRYEVEGTVHFESADLHIPRDVRG